MDNVTRLKKAAEEKCKNANIRYEFIPLPENLTFDIESHIAFHDITMKQAVPTLLFKTEQGFIVVQKRADTKIISSKLKKLVGTKSLNFANPEDLEQFGAEIGIVPLTGLPLSHFIDKKVLEVPVIYGGGGSKLFALKLNSKDLVSINNATIGDFTELI